MPSIDYLRLSVTDRCSLRCFYCQPRLTMVQKPRERILRVDEIHRIVSLLAREGIRRVRFTGGEPLERRNISELIANVATIPGIEDLALTTNGLHLPAMLDELLRVGIRRINLSIDSLDPQIGRRICGQLLPDPLPLLDTLLRAGLRSLKVNTVILRGINESQWLPMAELTRELPLAWRFIERMSMGAGDVSDTFLSAADLRERLAGHFPLETVPANQEPPGAGPARYWRIRGARGMIGFITPVSEHFCRSCNRIRLTAEGKLRACLLDGRETDLATPLRAGADDGELACRIRGLIAAKPEAERRQMDRRSMVEIGG